MKTLIIDSSFRERSADERMLAKIKSKENSSNCSCGQKAPEEYAAEPSCCARGTELLFTWRKNGDFEVRQPRCFLFGADWVSYSLILIEGPS